MCFHESQPTPRYPTANADVLPDTEAYSSSFSTLVGGDRVTIDVRPAPSGAGYVVALFNASYPRKPIVKRLANVASLTFAKALAEEFLDAYRTFADSPLAGLVKLSDWVASTGAENHSEDGYRGGEGIFSV